MKTVVELNGRLNCYITNLISPVKYITYWKIEKIVQMD
jgi:hypothetical protein